MVDAKGPAEDDIRAVCQEIADMLVSKQKSYGNSALDPVRIFSRADAVEQIKVRIDDKLSRLSRGHDMPDESRRDTIRDLAGYLILLQVAERRAARKLVETSEYVVWDKDSV